jgi:hypothetical protein
MSEIIAVVEYESTVTAPVVQNNNITVPTVGIQGLSATDLTVSNFTDVDASNLENGSVLVYKTQTSKWTSTRLLDQQFMEGGEF